MLAESMEGTGSEVEEVRIDAVAMDLRERQTSFMIFSSNSRQSGIIWSRSSHQTTNTRSSRYITMSRETTTRDMATYQECCTLLLVSSCEVSNSLYDLNASVGVNIEGLGGGRTV
jgi:hypothetical protein